jgi:hypothetical protein
MKGNKMTHPDAIVFVSNIQILKDKLHRSQSEIELDDTPEDKVVYSDLLFRLREVKGGYNRPGVILEKGKLTVVSNQWFFRALKEAGLQKILIDYVPVNRQANEAFIEQFGLEYASTPKPKTHIDRFLFFQDEPKYLETGSLGIIQPPHNKSEKYFKAHCQRFVIPIDYCRNESELIRKAVETNGKLRSIDGIKND